MKPICASLLFAIALFATYGQSAPNKAENARPPLTLALGFNSEANRPEDTTAQTVKAGAPITIRFRRTNIGDHAIPKVAPENGAFGCIWDVRDSSGNPVPPHRSTDEWIRIGGPGATLGPKDTEQKPGESIIGYAPVSNWFDLARPGTYTIQASQHVSTDPNSPVVKSNKLTVTVTP